MYIIQKTIYGRWNYWWNNKKDRWEGLKDNAEKFPEPLWAVVDMMEKLRLTDTEATYSYEKVK